MGGCIFYLQIAMNIILRGLFKVRISEVWVYISIQNAQAYTSAVFALTN